MDAPLDGARILETARGVAFPRYPGTQGDRRAIEIVGRELRAAGLEVRTEEFSYDLAPVMLLLRAALVATALALLAAGWLAAATPAGAAVLLLAGLAVGGLLLAWSPGAERLYRAAGPTVTANVVGRRPSRSAGPPRLRLVLVAHHDSKAQNLTFPVRMGLTLAAIGGTAGLALLVLLGLAGGAVPGPAWLAPAVAAVAALALSGLATLRSENRSPGGVDNGGSLAILLELARVLPAEVPDDVELIFLSTGAEEDHMVGAMRWLDAHLDGLRDRPLFALNLDGAGSPGTAVLIARYGFGRSFGKTVSAATAGCARKLGIPLRRIWMPPAIGVDGIPFAHRGVECPTLSSGSLGRATIAVHSRHDVADHLDPDALARVARLARGVAVEICRPST